MPFNSDAIDNQDQKNQYDELLKSLTGSQVQIPNQEVPVDQEEYNKFKKMTEDFQNNQTQNLIPSLPTIPSGEITPQAEQPSLFESVSNKYNQLNKEGRIGKKTEVKPQGLPSIDPITTSTPSDSKTSPTPELYGSDINNQALSKALKEQQTNTGLLNMIKGFTQIGGRGYADLSGIDKQIAQAGMPVEAIQSQRKAKTEELAATKAMLENATAQEEADPNSSVSKAMRAIAKQTGQDFGNASAAQMKASGFNAGQALIAQENRKTRETMMNFAKAGKDEKQLNQDFTKMGESISLSRLSGQAVQQAKQKLFAAERLEGLIKQFPDGNIPPIQTRELATSLGALLSPGAGSGTAVQQINELVPHTATGSAAKIAEWFTSNPTGSKQQAFIKLYSETVEREKEIAMNQIKNAKMEKASAYRHLQKKSPEAFNELLRSHDITPEDFQRHMKGEKLDITGGYNKWKGDSQKNSNPQDSEAVQWAKSNLDDPRAKQILKLNGIQ